MMMIIVCEGSATMKAQKTAGHPLKLNDKGMNIVAPDL